MVGRGGLGGLVGSSSQKADCKKGAMSRESRKGRDSIGCRHGAMPSTVKVPSRSTAMAEITVLGAGATSRGGKSRENISLRTPESLCRNEKALGLTPI